MAELAIAAVKETAHIQFTPEMYQKTYLNWMENIHDWCISRQLWWGHRIPAWHCSVCHKVTVARVDPTKCAQCGSEKIAQSTDVLDTWFSSGLLPVSVFGWPNITPENRADFDAFYPTSLLVTGFDILFFWVARMIMMGCWFAGDVPMPDRSERSLADSVPFREVYIHALVRDANREKMSKTKGNVIDPIEIVKQYGTDAVRFTLASMASPGTDIAFNVARTEGYRAFANKIWNAARFIFMNVDRAAEIGITVDRSKLGAMPTVAADAPLETRWITRELHVAAREVNLQLAEYRFDEAASTIYQFFWGSFCDWYLEIVKLRLDFAESADKRNTAGALATLVEVFEAALRLLSPFMPFITEELWHAVYDGMPPSKSIALSDFPAADENYIGGQILLSTPKDMKYLTELVSYVRFARKERQIPEKAALSIDVYALEDAKAALSANVSVISRLARVSEIRFSDVPLPGNVFRYISGGVRYEANLDATTQDRTIDVGVERERLTKDITKCEKGLASAESKLGSEAFLSKAPAHIVDGLKKQAAETRALLDKYRRDLDGLGS